MKTKITHLTSAHSRYDTRIFLKMCSSLAKNENYSVSLVVADGKGDESKNGVNIVDVGAKTGGRISRMTTTVKKVFQKAKELNSDIYHLHDPELISIGLKLKKLGFKVIFDAHENISKQILNKEYINKFLRTAVSKIYRAYENYALKKFDYLVLAENSYAKDYKKVANKYEIVLNMPDIKPLEKFYSKNRTKNELFYIGGISNDRGLDVTIEALNILKNKFPDIFMHYIGPFGSTLLESLNVQENKNIKFYGSIPLFEGMELSRNAKVGLSILKPIANYKESYSTKIFEYMAIGLPVITSNFQLYKDVIENYNCGICVNPLEPKEIATAIEYIITHPKEAEQMGQNGKKAVIEKYNWSVEEKKLFEVYEELIK
ncbi:glycosyltransferase family 4 protein [Sulfurimonas crateris]|uniref:Glycosyltransferase family 4 protein n=1 Tax=Sulfurimonas crateris TaxID=2574727 RepID=A0A4U2Z7B4_9BACT|nr:glycosyltransferase [Sulfurimonas crateris]TKI69894.1 glycosyltransferase family 4 protein [Sulfurimonas crateris]